MNADIQTILGLALAVVPGFVAVTVWSRARTWRGPANDFRTTLESIALSLVVHIAAAPLTIWLVLPKRAHLVLYPERVAVWLAAIVIVLPVVGGLGVAYIQDRVESRRAENPIDRLKRLVTTVQPPTAWDWLFTLDPPHGHFVVVEFNDGKHVGGVFTPGAYAITSPQQHGIFLCPEWLVNEELLLVEELPDSRGLLIPDLANVRWVRTMEGHSNDDT